MLRIPQISSYSLTVRATDNGHPAQFSEVAVRVHVSDVNDNPPRFFQLNYSVVVQVSQDAVCYPSLSQGAKVLMHRLLLEHKGGTAMKHAIALCSRPQKTAEICGGRCSANKCHLLLPMAAGIFCSFSSLLSHFPSLASSPFVHCVCPHIQQNTEQTSAHGQASPSLLDADQLLLGLKTPMGTQKETYPKHAFICSCTDMTQGENKGISTTVCF